jgi:hypothetical protein
MKCRCELTAADLCRDARGNLLELSARQRRRRGRHFPLFVSRYVDPEKVHEHDVRLRRKTLTGKYLSRFMRECGVQWP